MYTSIIFPYKWAEKTTQTGRYFGEPGLSRIAKSCRPKDPVHQCVFTTYSQPCRCPPQLRKYENRTPSLTNDILHSFIYSSKVLRSRAPLLFFLKRMRMAAQTRTLYFSGGGIPWSAVQLLLFVRVVRWRAYNSHHGFFGVHGNPCSITRKSTRRGEIRGYFLNIHCNSLGFDPRKRQGKKVAFKDHNSKY